jgi:hypothetical protein
VEHERRSGTLPARREREACDEIGTTLGAVRSPRTVWVTMMRDDRRRRSRIGVQFDPLVDWAVGGGLGR